MQGSSRREFIAQGGALVGAIWLAGPGAALGAPRSAALTEARRGTFGALAEAVVTEAPYRLPAAAAEQAAADFAARYAASDEAERTRADRVLDALERAEGRSFRGAGRGRRVQVLREHGEPRTSLPTGQERRRLDLAQDALALVGTVLGADTDLDHSPTTI